MTFKNNRKLALQISNNALFLGYLKYRVIQKDGSNFIHIFPELYIIYELST